MKTKIERMMQKINRQSSGASYVASKSGKSYKIVQGR